MVLQNEPKNERSNLVRAYYVVWVGRKPGIYARWDDAELQVQGFPGAKFKKIRGGIVDAENAFKAGYEAFYKNAPKQPVSRIKPRSGIAVDGSYSMKDNIGEFRGVDLETGEQIFRESGFTETTNNVMEFLALITGLRYIKDNKLTCDIYSDSVTAMTWVKYAVVRSASFGCTKTFRAVNDALEFARKEGSDILQVKKWETGIWGENPADFGRK